MDREDGSMTRQKVTDPALLAQLGESPRQKVTDPNLLAQLNAEGDNEEDAGAYLDNLPQAEGFVHKLPKDILIGLTHAGRNLHNLPHDLSKLAEWPVEKLAGPLKHPLSSYLPNDESDYSDVWGGNKENDTMMDKLIKGGVEHAPELIGGAGLVRGGFRRLTGAHQLDAVKNAVKQKGLQDFAYPKQMIKQAEKFLPSTKATKELVGEVNAGKYEPAFKLQSQVGHHQRKLAKSPLASENSIMAPKAGELKQQMLGHLETVLRNANHIEEADLLRKGINNYRQYIKVKQAVMPLIKYLGIPTTILGALSVGYNKSKQALSD
jgi:hypothetical protein